LRPASRGVLSVASAIVIFRRNEGIALRGPFGSRKRG
jgi:hypothetical protein